VTRYFHFARPAVEFVGLRPTDSTLGAGVRQRAVPGRRPGVRASNSILHQRSSPDAGDHADLTKPDMSVGVLADGTTR